MEIKIVTRNLNFDTKERKSSSRYRVKFGESTNFKILRVICNYGNSTQIYETNSENLPVDKDSIYFLAESEGNTFIIEWCSGAEVYMKRIQ